MNTNLLEKKIGEVVADNYKTAILFEKHKIDFCCNGNRSIEEALTEKEIDCNGFLNLLTDLLEEKSPQQIDFKTWPLDLLADYIEKTHHRYVEEKIPLLKQYVAKIELVHGGRHPELHEVKTLFFESADELTKHMKKEELMLFPHIRKMVTSPNSTNKPAFGTVKNPIAVMMEEHDNEGGRFREIEKLTDNYTPPADACNTYRVAFAMLKEFQDDLHKHIHLENNILFPKAEQLEANLTQN